MQNNTRDLHFFHGTSATAAANILRDGFRNALDEMGWGSLASDIWSALLTLGTEDQLHRWIHKYDDLLDGIWKPA